jgi:type IV pilus assembly protein PilO
VRETPAAEAIDMALLPEQPAQQRALVVGLIALAGVYAFHAYWYTGVNDTNVEAEARLEQLEDQNRRAQIIATRGGDDMVERLAQFERHISKLEELIPENEQVPALLNSMTAEALRLGVDLSLMRPEPEQPGPYYTMVTYEMSVTGAYHDVARFLTSIASLRRIVTPIDLDVVNPQFAVSADLVTANFRIQTYILPTRAAGTAGGGP